MIPALLRRMLRGCRGEEKNQNGNARTGQEAAEQNKRHRSGQVRKKRDQPASAGHASAPKECEETFTRCAIEKLIRSRPRQVILEKRDEPVAELLKTLTHGLGPLRQRA